MSYHRRYAVRSTCGRARDDRELGARRTRRRRCLRATSTTRLADPGADVFFINHTIPLGQLQLGASELGAIWVEEEPISRLTMSLRKRRRYPLRSNCSRDKNCHPANILAVKLTILLCTVRGIYSRRSSFIASWHPHSRHTAGLRQAATPDDTLDPSQCSIYTAKLTTASGKPVCRYALGGAARSVQSEYLPLEYRDLLSRHAGDVAPFYFYYNPHRYPAFLSGIADSFISEDGESKNLRRDMFIASGGSERSHEELDQRLRDALAFSGGDYLDGFVLEYVCPYELTPDNQMDSEMAKSIEHVHKMKDEGKVRYVIASTHSHAVGAALASATLPSHPDNGPGRTPAFDALMLRYSMSHKIAAETLSFPNALGNNIPVLAFTTTRWNRLQYESAPVPAKSSLRPTTSDCIKFALRHPAVEVVLHSARDEEELEESLLPLISSSSHSNWLSEDQLEQWRLYGRHEAEWNGKDDFDEYPKESVESN
ncbi:hypothetical protein ACHAWF_015552 [Thalassiosira exigua]